MEHHDLLVQTFLGEGNLGRFVQAEHQSFPFYYVAVLMLGLLPWSAGLPAALAFAARPARWQAERAPGAAPGPLYWLCWFGAVLFVFSLSASKLSTYVLPAFPPAALLLGEYWAGALEAAGPARRSRAAMLSAGMGLLLAAALALAAGRLAQGPEWGTASASLTVLGAVLVGGALVSFVMVRQGRLEGLLASQSGTMLAVVMLFVFVIGPRIEPARSTGPLVRELKNRGLSLELAGAYRERDFSLDFYLGRTVPRAPSLRALERQVLDNPGRIWVVPTESVGQVTNEGRLKIEVVALSPKSVALRLSPDANN